MATAEQKLPLWPAFNLNNGHNLPAIGLGTFTIKDRDTIFYVVDASLKAGYRSFDTAAVYGNERFIGEALEKYLPKYDLMREDIHVTSKLTNADQACRKRVMDGFAKTEANLGFPPDLYLIHCPPSALLTPNDNKNKVHRHTAWRAMAELYDTGCVNSIGVSNFTIRHLEQLLLEYHSDTPVVNQVEWNPLHHDDTLLKYCNKNSIQLQGYHCLGGTECNSQLLTNSVLQVIADDHSVNIPQVLLTWSLHKRVAVTPKSTCLMHIEENLNINFTLTPEEIHTIDTLTQSRRSSLGTPILSSKYHKQ